MKKINLLFLPVLMIASVMVNAKEYHVSVHGDDANTGSEALPFKTIYQANQYAYPGDIITVHEGVYREWVNPIRGGESDDKRIVYRAAPGEHVEIKGSEIASGWEKVNESVWKVVIENNLFKDYNPYQDSIYGDWFTDLGRIHHTGEVFLNNKSLFEKESLNKVLNPVPDKKINDTAGSIYTWYCESNESTTTIWANFHDYDPNKELVEISTRPTCFYPERQGIDYITISGFHISQAATQWGAPTAEQIGMIATHWNKGWIIENNIISNSKCSGITLGKERSTGHNVWSNDKSIDGSIHYVETTFRTLKHGWSKENIGSHIVRNNTIFDCEQTGICGSMGAAFSTIENNHIYDIWTKRQFRGAEIGGIKFHAAIDATIRKNRIHDCGRGLWLDWMTQGTRVSGNLFHDNDKEDLFLEVNHGPFIIDNNIFLSQNSLRNQSQGGAYVHNLFGGGIYMWPEPNRFTPYHLPHSTEVAGLSTIYSGDDRYYNNLFIGPDNKGEIDKNYKAGLKQYSEAELPVFINNNVYYKGAKPFADEVSKAVDIAYDPDLTMIIDGDQVFLKMTLDQSFFALNGEMITSELLGKAKIPKAKFENTDSTSLQIDKDYFGNVRGGEHVAAGPFSSPDRGELQLKVW